MKNIHVYIAEEGYAARVQDTRSYEAIRCVASIGSNSTYLFQLTYHLCSAPSSVFFGLLPPPFAVVARTSYQDGPSHLYRMIITLEVTFMNTGEEIDTFPRITQLFWQGKGITVLERSLF